MLVLWTLRRLLSEVTNLRHLVHSCPTVGLSKDFPKGWDVLTITPVTYQLPACCAEILVNHTESTPTLSVGQASWEEGITGWSWNEVIISFPSGLSCLQIPVSVECRRRSLASGAGEHPVTADHLLVLCGFDEHGICLLGSFCPQHCVIIVTKPWCVNFHGRCMKRRMGAGPSWKTVTQFRLYWGYHGPERHMEYLQFFSLQHRTRHEWPQTTLRTRGFGIWWAEGRI